MVWVADNDIEEACLFGLVVIGRDDGDVAFLYECVVMIDFSQLKCIDVLPFFYDTAATDVIALPGRFQNLIAKDDKGIWEWRWLGLVVAYDNDVGNVMAVDKVMVEVEVSADCLGGDAFGCVIHGCVFEDENMQR